MEERTVEITIEEYKELIRQSEKLLLIAEYVKYSEYIDRDTIKGFFGMYEKEVGEE